MGNIGVVFGALGQTEEADRLISDVIAIIKRNENIGVLFGRQILATILIQRERFDSVKVRLREVIYRQQHIRLREFMTYI
ncbi:hypothetical protein F5X98DRAFT_350863 [Xylaria grammica]|nr:hypothetical protein F5X98DRAFT_350863 [Xylaria grammica]